MEPTLDAYVCFLAYRAATDIIAPGTVYRMDEVPLPLHPPLKSPYPTDEDVIRRIREKVETKDQWWPAW